MKSRIVINTGTSSSHRKLKDVVSFLNDSTNDLYLEVMVVFENCEILLDINDTVWTQYEYFKGNLNRIMVQHDGKLNDSVNPSIVTYHENGKIKAEHWYIDSVTQSLSGPFHNKYDEAGTLIMSLGYIDPAPWLKKYPILKEYHKKYSGGLPITEMRVAKETNLSKNAKAAKKKIATKYHFHFGDVVVKVRYVDETDTVLKEQWFKDDELSRDDAPAVLSGMDGKVTDVEWREDGKALGILKLGTKTLRHNKHIPFGYGRDSAIRLYDLCYDRGYRPTFMMHTKKTSVFKDFYRDGEIKNEIHFKLNSVHKDNGPAWIDHFKSGQPRCEKTMHNGEYDSHEGPAIIRYDERGRTTKTVWYIDDSRTNFRNWVKRSSAPLHVKVSMKMIYN